MSSPNLVKQDSNVSKNSRASSENMTFMSQNVLDGDLDLSPSNSQINGQQKPTSPPPTRLAPRSPGGNARLVVAIDFGTTFTGLAFATTYSDRADLSQIVVHQDWTTPKKGNQQNSQAKNPYRSKATSTMSNVEKVPSVISYSEATQGEAQWGADFSEDALTMVNTKLELQTQTLHEELDLTLHLLKGTKNLAFEHIREAGPEPAYTFRSPTEIITKYLSKVFECFYANKEVDVEQLALTRTPIDVVITVPVDWSFQANDAMFKAVRGAGFNKKKLPTLKDTILVSEPEAASYFTARDLHERGIEFLEVDDCFILCDAGGGTADVVSYQVKRLKPHFELVKATSPTGDKCGSALIDVAFKEWLKQVIGPEEYHKIDPANSRSQRISPHTAETGPMRKLIKDFIEKKKVYPNPTEQNIKLDLPGLNDLSIEGYVKEGELRIPKADMKMLMDKCVNGVIELINHQVDLVSNQQRRRVRNVFLVGGFGASPYLYKELEMSLELYEMQLSRPDAKKSLTATVQGAVVYGVEKSRHSDCRYLGAITKSYGIVQEGQFQWLIRKGDLVVSNEKRHIESKNFWCPWTECTNNKCDFSVFVYKARSEVDDRVPALWQNGIHEVNQVGVVKCDFGRFLAQGSRPPYPSNHPNALTPGNPELGLSAEKIGPLKWQLQVSNTSVVAELLLKDKSLGKCDFKPETDFPVEHRRSSGASWGAGDD